MNRKLRAHIILLPLLVLCTLFFFKESSAQVYNTKGNSKATLNNKKIVSDTIGFAEKAKDNSVRIFYKNARGEKKYYDTSIVNIHQHGLLNPWQISLGNLGGAYQSLKAEAKLPETYSLLSNKWNAYRYTKEGVRYYNTTKPFSEVRYTMGSKQEQFLELMHTQNIQPNWNFSTRYRKINSQGFFKAQRNNIDNFSFATHYNSKNKRYNILSSFRYNKIQQDENLGIVSNTFLTNDQFSNRALIPVWSNVAAGVKRSPILNYNRDINLNVVQKYSMGKSWITYDDDSIKEQHFKPILTFKNELYYNNERYCFSHNRPDTAFQLLYLNQPFPFDDTLTVGYNNKIIGTNISAEGNVYFKEKVFSVLGGVGVEYQKIEGDSISKNGINNYILGELSNRKSQDSAWIVDAKLKFYFAGIAQGNLKFDAKVGKVLSEKLGEVGLVAVQYIQQPFYVSESLQVSHSLVEQKLQSQINTKLGGYYSHKKYRFRASLNSLLINNLIYATQLQPNYQQYQTPISILQAEINKGFKFRNWHFENQILLQVMGNNTPIQIPLIASFHRMAYSKRLFKNKMAANMGLDIYFNSAYNVDGYQPVFQSFVYQTTSKQSFIPRINPFFNFKIKRFRASINLDQLQHLFIKNNINYISYPAQGFAFRFGLRWAFVN